MSLLDGKIKPRRAVNGDYENSLPDEEKAQVRAHALEVLKAYRERGCTLPPPPSERQIHAMMSFLVGEQIAQEYVPMMMEELALDGVDSRAFHWDKPVTPEQKQKFKVLVIGAGMSGLLAAIRLGRGRHPLHRGREERSGGWHLVRKQLSRMPGGLSQPLLLFLVRAQPRMAALLLAPRRTICLFQRPARTSSGFAHTSAFPPR